MRLRSHTGRTLRELHGMPVPPAASLPGGKETVLLEVLLPDTPGLYELFVDVVEEGVCWFSDRGSPPLVCEIQVLAGIAKAWQYRGFGGADIPGVTRAEAGGGGSGPLAAGA